MLKIAPNLKIIGKINKINVKIYIRLNLGVNTIGVLLPMAILLIIIELIIKQIKLEKNAKIKLKINICATKIPIKKQSKTQNLKLKYGKYRFAL